jgi:hypothetical protein
MARTIRAPTTVFVCAALLCASSTRLLAGPAYSPVPAPAKLGPAEKAQLKAALKEARQKAAKRAHTDAATAWERVASLQPSRMKALVEAGWEALQAGDLDRADRLTKKALGFAVEPRLRGAGEYNLGIVAERRNDKPGAIAAYKRSLDARHTRAAREALAKLDPVAAAEADSVKPKILAGPFKTIEECCGKSGEPNGDGPTCPVELGPFKDDAKKVKGKGPWKAARVIGDESNGECSIALLTAKGWYVGASFTCFAGSHLDQTIAELAFRDVVPGGAPELVLRRTDETMAREEIEWDDGEGNSEKGMAMMTTGCEEWTTICGLRADGTPSCIEVQTAFADHESCGANMSWKWQLDLDFTSAGQIDVTGKGKLSVDEKALTGKRPFAF